jgi:hypothetical protein
MHTLMLQTAFSVPAVILASRLFQINGVAVVTNLVLIIGLVYMLRQARDVVDVSLRRMLLVPTVGFVVGCGLAWSSGLFITGQIARLIGKAVVFAGVYDALLLLFEREDYVEQLRSASRFLLRRR